uniref:sulfatase-like hydrolase/transferase n=1 Tax=Cyclobacterium roseum TaxID=2666137 RepID=UPI0013919295|nr:sulfatase-like hydrolase/transferase [Cyclobacterium roseum]
MKRSNAVFALLLVLCAATSGVSSTTNKAAPPNFIFILTDDQGWRSTSIGMDDRFAESKSDFFETPSIDRLSREGIRFTNAYAPAAICSPTRRSILFGLADIVNSLQVAVGHGTLSGSGCFVVGVCTQSGDYFLCVSNFLRFHSSSF